ncbi:hypothetical protein BD626DRAFT_567167 [Schizophyllum amplum]|uniref:Uncharacterized protein n=1 Tax=Schizophyllum amplum TaxID=97359 RepID=A0A550CKF0_9AGAR|nr:hypothetical protein BD626DRAFT_567167 [Auriculariopsis ampla]
MPRSCDCPAEDVLKAPPPSALAAEVRAHINLLLGIQLAIYEPPEACAMSPCGEPLTIHFEGNKALTQPRTLGDHTTAGGLHAPAPRKAICESLRRRACDCPAGDMLKSPPPSSTHPILDVLIVELAVLAAIDDVGLGRSFHGTHTHAAAKTTTLLSCTEHDAVALAVLVDELSIARTTNKMTLAARCGRRLQATTSTA